MTEADWLACADPVPMLEFLANRDGLVDRKLRVFAVACCRRIWDLVRGERSRAAVMVAARYAERCADATALQEARAFAQLVTKELEARLAPSGGRDGVRHHFAAVAATATTDADALSAARASATP